AEGSVRVERSDGWWGAGHVGGDHPEVAFRRDEAAEREVLLDGKKRERIHDALDPAAEMRHSWRGQGPPPAAAVDDDLRVPREDTESLQLQSVGTLLSAARIAACIRGRAVFYGEGG